jgi:hypothetical protein
MSDGVLNIKSAPPTSLISTETAMATDMSFAQALSDPDTQPDEVCC